MKKITILTLIAIMFFGVTNAQSFFKAVPKPITLHFAVADSTIGTPATQNLIRPVANIASYTIPGNSLLSGAGIAYEHLKWNATTGRWDEVWSINALAWDKASLTGDPSQFAYGIAAGILGKGLIGIATTDMKSFFLTLGLKINFNN